MKRDMDTNPGGVSPRKHLAMSGRTDFGCGPYPGSKSSPITGPSVTGELPDSRRGVPPAKSAAGRHMPGQAAPDHG